MATMVHEAIASGVEHYGFTPHSPIPFDSPCNMEASQTDAYFAEVARLRKDYARLINLYAGMEIDYLGKTWGPSHPYFDTLPLDYRIGSVHFIPTPDGSKEIDVDGRPDGFARKLAEYFDGDLRYVIDTFYARSLEMIEAGGFDIIGHFDKIGFNATWVKPGIEDEPFYRRHIDDMVDAIREKGIIAEVNTKSWIPRDGASTEEILRLYPRLFPSAHVIGRLVKAGVPLAVNSDSHYPKRITTGREAAFAIIDSFSGKD